jgi:HlyD family secretion protein
VKKLLAFLIVLGLLFIGTVYWYNRSSNGKNGEEAYAIAPVEFGTLTETISATGLVQPHKVIAVGSQLSGQVIEVYPSAEVNHIVKEGDPLLKLDDRKAQLDLQQAKTAVRAAQMDVQRAKTAQAAAQIKFDRLSDLLKREVGKQQEVDQADMELRAAKDTVAAAELKVQVARDAEATAQLGVDLTIVRVGTEGNHSSAQKAEYTVIDRKVTLGQLIGPPASAQLFTLASDLKRMQVHAQVSENDIGKMREGLAATFTVYAYSEDDTRFDGRITEIRPMPTNQHGAVFYDTIIDVPNRKDTKTKELMLRPGMTAAVDVILRRHADTWKMPTAALSLQLDEHYQTEAAKAKLASWQARANAEDWKAVWILDEHGKPWPIFVKIGGTKAGETGIKDSQFNEVLEWDPELATKPTPGAENTYPRVIIGAPPPPRRSLFDRPNVKLF